MIDYRKRHMAADDLACWLMQQDKDEQRCPVCRARHGEPHCQGCVLENYRIAALDDKEKPMTDIDTVFLTTDGRMGFGYARLSIQENVNLDALIAAYSEARDVIIHAKKAAKALTGTLAAHEIESRSCDRDGKRYCECVREQAAALEAALGEKETNDAQTET